MRPLVNRSGSELGSGGQEVGTLREPGRSFSRAFSVEPPYSGGFTIPDVLALVPDVELDAGGLKYGIGLR